MSDNAQNENGAATVAETPKSKTPAKASKPKASKAPAPKRHKDTIRVTGRKGSKAISGTGTIKELSAKLNKLGDRKWETPTTTALVNGLVMLGQAKDVGAEVPAESRKGRTGRVFTFNAKA